MNSIDVNATRYDCMMIPVSFFYWNNVLKEIDDSDVYDADGRFGKEFEPHVSILYGIEHGSFDERDMLWYTRHQEPLFVKTLGCGLFENELFDVLKFNIELTTELAEMRKYAETLPHANIYPDYNPHCTIAHLNKGAGSKYLNMINKKYSFTCISNSILYSDAHGCKREYCFGK